MTTYTIVFRHSDTGLALTLAFSYFKKLSDGTDPTNIVPASFSEIGQGMYKFDYVPAEAVAFEVNGGISIPEASRYVRGILEPSDAYLDAAVTSRASATDYTPTRAGYLDTINTNLDAAITTRASATDYTPTRAGYLDTINTNLDMKISEISVSVDLTTTNDKIDDVQATANSIEGKVDDLQLDVTTIGNTVATNLDEKSSDILTAVEAVDLTTVSTALNTLLDHAEGKWEINKNTQRLVLYKRNGDALMSFDLKDIEGNPTYYNFFSRTPV